MNPLRSSALKEKGQRADPRKLTADIGIWHPESFAKIKRHHHNVTGGHHSRDDNEIVHKVKLPDEAAFCPMTKAGSQGRSSQAGQDRDPGIRDRPSGQTDDGVNASRNAAPLPSRSAPASAPGMAMLALFDTEARISGWPRPSSRARSHPRWRAISSPWSTTTPARFSPAPRARRCGWPKIPAGSRSTSTCRHHRMQTTSRFGLVERNHVGGHVVCRLSTKPARRGAATSANSAPCACAKSPW